MSRQIGLMTLIFFALMYPKDVSGIVLLNPAMYKEGDPAEHGDPPSRLMIAPVRWLRLGQSQGCPHDPAKKHPELGIEAIRMVAEKRIDDQVKHLEIV